jgi:hypothetical protein
LLGQKDQTVFASFWNDKHHPAHCRDYGDKNEKDNNEKDNNEKDNNENDNKHCAAMLQEAKAKAKAANNAKAVVSWQTTMASKDAKAVVS